MAKVFGAIVVSTLSGIPIWASFTSPQQLRKAIDDFVAAYNENAAPFEWKKAVVFQSGPKQKYSDL